MSKAKSRRKYNIEVKVECAIQNKYIDGLAINHNPAPLPKEEQMQVLDVDERESFSKIDLNDVSLWLSTKKTCRLGALITSKLSKERNITLVARSRPFCATCKYN
jgi:hypothetical protein